MSTSPFKDVIVNRWKITIADIAAEAQNHSAPKGKPGIAWRKAAQALVIRRLLLEEASLLGITAEPRSMGKGRRETDEEARIRAVIEASVHPSLPSEAAIRQAYERDIQKFRSPCLYEAAHILFPARPDDRELRRSARTEARRILEMLKKSPGQFDKAARESSACPSAANGGRLGQIASGDTVPEFEQALDRLVPGEIAADPVDTRYGYHILRLDAKSEGRTLPLETVRPQISEALEKASWADAARRFVVQLVGKAEIEGVDMNPVRSEGKPGLFPAGKSNRPARPSVE